MCTVTANLGSRLTASRLLGELADVCVTFHRRREKRSPLLAPSLKSFKRSAIFARKAVAGCRNLAEIVDQIENPQLWTTKCVASGNVTFEKCFPRKAVSYFDNWIHSEMLDSRRSIELRFQGLYGSEEIFDRPVASSWRWNSLTEVEQSKGDISESSVLKIGWHGRSQFKRAHGIVQDRGRSRGLSKDRSFEDRLGAL